MGQGFANDDHLAMMMIFWFSSFLVSCVSLLLLALAFDTNLYRGRCVAGPYYSYYYWYWICMRIDWPSRALKLFWMLILIVFVCVGEKGRVNIYNGHNDKNDSQAHANRAGHNNSLLLSMIHIIYEYACIAWSPFAFDQWIEGIVIENSYSCANIILIVLIRIHV